MGQYGMEEIVVNVGPKTAGASAVGAGWAVRRGYR